VCHASHSVATIALENNQFTLVVLYFNHITFSLEGVPFLLSK
jgi:hypothetical protein